MTAHELCYRILNLPWEEAERVCGEAGYRFRVCGVDGAPRITTRDFRLDRISAFLENGLVVRAHQG